ncbi:alanine racemase [Kiritimatiellota bacterium B12222]|nr:alanine racemase [Kiritimatiellota bacterium B12222]
MQKTFEPPRLDLLSGQPGNPHARRTGASRALISEIAGVPVRELTERYGSPLFVYDEAELKRNLFRWKQAFETLYQPVRFAWSYKTCYLRGICQCFHEEGSLAEVVSEMEYHKARKSGVPGKNIILNGPHKSQILLREALKEGAILHIDHFDEVDDVLAIADESDHKLKVGIRVNMDAGIQPVWSRFGFNFENGEAQQALTQLLRHPHIQLSGVHCHIGTYILDPQAYALMTQKLLTLAYWAEDRFDQRIEHLDLGGGFPSPARLKGIYHSPEVYLPPPSEYAEAIVNSLQANLRPGHLPQLLLESGRALVDSAGWLLSSVLARKVMPDGRDLVVMDAGVNVLYTATWYEIQASLTQKHEGEFHSTQLVGPLCMNIDVLHPEWMLPALERGEILCIPNVGAYNVTQSMQFIVTRPAVVLLREDGSEDLIRRAETLSDVEMGEG